MAPFVQEKWAIVGYAHLFHREHGEVKVYRNGEHQYSYRSNLDGREHEVMVTADPNDLPPGFVSDHAKQYRGFYLYCPEDAGKAATERDQPRPPRKKGIQR